MRWVVFLSVFVMLFALGCSRQEKVVVSEGQEVTAQQQVAQGKEGVTPGEAVGQGEVSAKEYAPSTQMESQQPSGCELREFPNIHFAFDRYDLNEEAKRILSEIAEYMKECPDVILTIEGHCDERGSNEYNLALGWKRANEAKKFLVTLGIDPSRIITVSYGEERPLCYEHNEECWAKNRRDHFVFCRGQCLR